jgi:hypothetical protein
MGFLYFHPIFFGGHYVGGLWFGGRFEKIIAFPALRGKESALD